MSRIHQPFLDSGRGGLLSSIRNSPYPLWYTLLWPLFFRYPATFRWSKPNRCSTAFQRIDTPEGQDVTVLFAGDIMVLNGDQAPRLSPELIELMQTADLFAANCEAPVGYHKQDPRKRYSFLFHMPMNFLTQIIQQASIPTENIVLTNANNHSGDAGQAAFDTSRTILDDLGITTLGFQGYSNVKIKNSGGISLGFSGWTHWVNCGVFHSHKGPVSHQDMMNHDLKSDIQRQSIDFMIGMPHWEYEFQHFPRQTTRKHAEKFTKQGFDLLVGSHPHVLQPYEWFDSKLCIYSLGNFCGLGVAWPVKIIPLIEVKIRKTTKNSTFIQSYTTHFFWQRHSAEGVSLEPIEKMPPALVQKARDRIAKVLIPC